MAAQPAPNPQVSSSGVGGSVICCWYYCYFYCCYCSFCYCGVLLCIVQYSSSTAGSTISTMNCYSNYNTLLSSHPHTILTGHESASSTVHGSRGPGDPTELPQLWWLDQSLWDVPRSRGERLCFYPQAQVKLVQTWDRHWCDCCCCGTAARRMKRYSSRSMGNI